MELIELKTYCKNWRLAQIDPARKELKVFLDDRALQIKKAMSRKEHNPERIKKAINEEKFLTSIVDLDQAHSDFMDSIENLIVKSLIQYEDYINNGTKLREQNKFLKDRLDIMDKRELTYLELLSNKS